MHLKPLSELFAPLPGPAPIIAKPTPEAAPAVVHPTVAEPPKDKASTTPIRKGTSQLSLDFVEPAKPVAHPAAKPATKPVTTAAAQTAAAHHPSVAGQRDINTKAVFCNGNAATGKELDAVLKHYGSPHAGKGETIASVCRAQNINPILLVAVMQQKSSFGNKNNLKTLKPENIANPWSVHFNEHAKGIAKLRLKSGEMPSFEQSLNGAIKTLKKLSGQSETPLSTAGARYSATSSWTHSVQQHYLTLLGRVGKSRA